MGWFFVWFVLLGWWRFVGSGCGWGWLFFVCFGCSVCDIDVFCYCDVV